MKTMVFENYLEFLKREDKTMNGVSAEHSAQYPNWESDNDTNESCWNCIDCSFCSDCIDCRDCSDCRFCNDCRFCSDCSFCSFCSDCRDCIDCSDCSFCSDCSGYVEFEKNIFPKIENIHQKIFEVTTPDNALNMSDWHTCKTTHCRAGWVVTLAGEKGKELEEKLSTPLAAAIIYRESSQIPVKWALRFFENDEDARADIARCAELEKAQEKK